MKQPNDTEQISNEYLENKRPKPPVSNRRTLLKYLKGGLRFVRFLLVNLRKREVSYILKRPIDALLFLTYRCTSKCQSCTLWQRTDKTGEMSLEEWIRVVDELAERGARNIELFGGDALLRPDVLVPLVRHIKSRSELCSDLVTNCNMMTEKTARELVAAGLHDLWMSIDGVEETQNRIRGRSKTWSQIEHTIDWFLEARAGARWPRLRVNTTISNMNYDAFHEILPYAEKKGFDECHLEYVGEFWDSLLDESVIDGIRPTPYFVRQGGRSVLVNEEQAKIVKAKVAEMKAAARHMRIKLNTENIDRLTVRQMVEGDCDNRKCYIMRNKVTVDPRGNVLGCPFFGDWILGNIRDRHLRDIWGNSKHKSFIEHFSKKRMKLCKHCILGVQRNPSPFQSIRNYLNQELGRARM